MKLSDGSNEWWHCPSCGFELQREIAPSSCSLCKTKNDFVKGRFTPKKTGGSYDAVLAELKKYEEGCEPVKDMPSCCEDC